MSEENDPSPTPPPVSPGLSIIGLLITGVVGIVIGIEARDGLALLASAFSFGLVAWIAFR